jgi:hypothetical protein
MQYSCNFTINRYLPSYSPRAAIISNSCSCLSPLVSSTKCGREKKKKKKPAISARIGPKRHTTYFHKDKEANKTLRKTKLQTSVTLTVWIPPRYFHFFRSDKTKEKAREKQRTSCRNLAPGMQNRGKMKMKTVKWKRTNTQTRRRTKGGNG